MTCRHCGQHLLHSPVLAGNPPTPYWVTLPTYRTGHLGFTCPHHNNGHHPAPPRGPIHTTIRRMIHIITGLPRRPQEPTHD